MELEEMVYTYMIRRTKPLWHGITDGFEWYILSLGTHPTAYVNLKGRCNSIDTRDLCVHGGITYTEDILRVGEADYEGFWIGWDYAHYGDLIGLDPEEYSDMYKHWTTQEIYSMDVIPLIRQLKEMEAKK